MQRSIATVFLGIQVGLCAASLCAHGKEPGAIPKLPADEIVAAWAKAGGELGWITFDSEEELTWRGTNVEPQAGFLPVIRFSEQFPAGKLKSIAQPTEPFGVWLNGTQAGFDELKQALPEAKIFP